MADVSELAATDQVAVLRRAAHLLATSTEFDATLAHTIAACLPALGDFGFFDVVVEGTPMRGTVRRTSRAHEDPDIEAILAPTQWVRSERTDINLCALSSGEPALHPDIDDAWYQKIAVNEGHLDVLRRLAFRSMLTVPMRYQNELVGALTLFYGRSQRRHSEDHCRFAADLAALAVPVVVNARLVAEADHARREAESANRAKDEFLAILGHELRNPLAPIISALELMKQRGTYETRREREIIERQVTHVSRLVDDLLDVSRIVRGKVELHRQPLDLASAVDKAIEMMRPLFERRGIELHVDLCSTWVDADPLRLAQVAGNLLTNASKFTPPGGRVDVVLAERDGEAVLEVRDTGQGIAPDLLPRIFGLFVQGPQALDRRQGGLGLGLAIIANLVDLHGGTVEAHSPGVAQGSTFVVRLPRIAPPDAIAHIDRSTPAAYTGSGRVLLVDDNEDTAELLGELLRQSGYIVQVATSAGSALERVADGLPDLAILDIGLPGVDGYELAARLRAMRDADKLRLVAVTGYGRDSDRERARAAGFDAHLTKPVHPMQLLEVLERMLAR